MCILDILRTTLKHWSLFYILPFNFQALILDATFDDLLPLAQAKMPRSWALLVEFIVRTYFDMPIALQVKIFSFQ